MSEQADPTGEMFDGSMNMTLMHGSRIIETIARQIEQNRREEQAQLDQQERERTTEAREAERAERDQFKDQRDAARMKYDRVMHDAFWKAPNAKDLADTIETALKWRGQDPKADVACDKIDAQLRASGRGVTLADLEDAMNRREAERERAEHDRNQAAGHEEDQEHSEDRAEAAQDRAQNEADLDGDGQPDPTGQEQQAHQHAQDATHEGSEAAQEWDSAAARQARADYWDANYDAETAAAAKSADRSQGTHPSHATYNPDKGGARGAIKGRKMRELSAGRGQERSLGR